MTSDDPLLIAHMSFEQVGYSMRHMTREQTITLITELMCNEENDKILNKLLFCYADVFNDILLRNIPLTNRIFLEKSYASMLNIWHAYKHNNIFKIRELVLVFSMISARYNLKTLKENFIFLQERLTKEDWNALSDLVNAPHAKKFYWHNNQMSVVCTLMFLLITDLPEQIFRDLENYCAIHPVTTLTWDVLVEHYPNPSVIKEQLQYELLLLPHDNVLTLLLKNPMKIKEMLINSMTLPLNTANQELVILL